MLESFVPTDYDVHEDVVDFTIDALIKKPVIKFCSGKNAKNSSTAAVVTDLRLYQIEF